MFQQRAAELSDGMPLMFVPVEPPLIHAERRDGEADLVGISVCALPAATPGRVSGWWEGPR